MNKSGLVISPVQKSLADSPVRRSLVVSPITTVGACGLRQHN
ncbi:hypothetical protein CsSME_00030051 [Camellia sinensis var. sinensis]